MKDLISEIARALVDRPDEVTVNEVEGGQTLILELKVAKQDMGKQRGASFLKFWNDRSGLKLRLIDKCNSGF
ncbi:MAG: hypothetical protein P8185_05145 [Deltaproteobacteria bacterium]